MANTYRKKRKTGLDLTTGKGASQDCLIYAFLYIFSSSANHTNAVCTTDEEITSGEDEVTTYNTEI